MDLVRLLNLGCSNSITPYKICPFPNWELYKHTHPRVQTMPLATSGETQQITSASKITQKNPSTPQNTHVFRSKLPDIPLPNNIPLHAYCFQNLPQVAHRPCLTVHNGGKTYTYRDTHLISQKLAAGFSNLGIHKGDVIMILLPNSPEFVFSFFAASMLGAIVTTANLSYTAAEITKQLNLSNAKLIITQAMQVQKFREQDPTTYHKEPRIKIITVDNPLENCMQFSTVMEADERDLPAVEIEPEDPVALLFSSGTTGLPKGAVLTHKSLTTNVAQTVEGENPNMHLKEEDVVLCVLPLFHVFALHCVMLCSLRRGSEVLLVERIEIIRTLLGMVERHRVTVAMVVPTQVRALAKNPLVKDYDLSSIRLVMSGASRLGEELEEALLTKLPHAVLGQAYGMTESGPVISMCMGFAKQPIPTKSGSCGTVVRNAELKVINLETGSSLPYNQPGEICIRGPHIMKGYLKDEKATAATIDAEGWLHTGDIGYVDDDDEIFIVDRVKEIIKYKGFQVPPAELEDLLMKHPFIADAAVVPQNDDVAGEVPVAFVVRSNGFDMTEEDVKKFIAEQVVLYKRLHKVYFIDAIPKSSTGKILRRDLKAKLASSTQTA